MAKGKPKYKCLRCSSIVKRQEGKSISYLCPMCGEMTSYYVKEMKE